MKICITLSGPGTDLQGLYQIPGQSIRFFWNFKGELKTFSIGEKFLGESAGFLTTHGVDL